MLVYGSGTLAFAAIALLRHLYPAAEVWAATRPAPGPRSRPGSARTPCCPPRPDELVAQVARRVGTTPLEPWSKRDWLQDGPAVVYDTIGSVETVETSLRLLATGGTLVISGVEPPKRFEWTPLYFKELRVIGSNGFGIEEVGGVAKHAMEHYFDFISDGLDLTPVITHRFPLERWDEAVLALKNSRRTGAVKVLLEPAGAEAPAGPAVVVAGPRYLRLATRLLQQMRLASPTGGIWEAADVQWWSREERPTDRDGQLFWLDERGEPLAAVIPTDFGHGVQCDVLVLPDNPDLERVAWRAAISQVDASGVPSEFPVRPDNVIAIAEPQLPGSDRLPRQASSSPAGWKPRAGQRSRRWRPGYRLLSRPEAPGRPIRSPSATARRWKNGSASARCTGRSWI